MTRLHDDEIEVDEGLVRRLLGTVSAAYDELPLRRFEVTGSTNALFRLSDDLLVRVPRQPGGTETIEKEQRWLPYVAPHLPVAVPEIVAVGDPAVGYPEKWSVVRYLEGDRPGLPTDGDEPRHELAAELAAVVRAFGSLGVPDEAAGDAALQWYRGRPLAEMDDSMQSYLHDSRHLVGHPDLTIDLDAVASAWARTMCLPGAHREVEPRWYHGDLNAENLLVQEGRLVAVLDFGGLSIGDPTIDLVVAWQLLDPAARRTFRDLLAVDDVTWRLACGWVLALSVMGLPYYWDTMRDRCLRGLHTGREALADLAEM
ncbi:MAG TPA: aminoglycoside phosphotransferase family protein [Nocardioides sp.]|nr:aminoglycoside phosphotransferase family protein [Nocardioides sp.]